MRRGLTTLAAATVLTAGASYLATSGPLPDCVDIRQDVLAAISTQWSDPVARCTYDLNGNGQVDMQDVSLATQWECQVWRLSGVAAERERAARCMEDGQP